MNPPGRRPNQLQNSHPSARARHGRGTQRPVAAPFRPAGVRGPQRPRAGTRIVQRHPIPGPHRGGVQASAPQVRTHPQAVPSGVRGPQGRAPQGPVAARNQIGGVGRPQRPGAVTRVVQQNPTLGAHRARVGAPPVPPARPGPRPGGPRGAARFGAMRNGVVPGAPMPPARPGPVLGANRARAFGAIRQGRVPGAPPLPPPPPVPVPTPRMRARATWMR